MSLKLNLRGRGSVGEAHENAFKFPEKNIQKTLYPINNQTS
jgi:hypothetical protein